MKRCPQCRRDYLDETLLYCLDDGTALLDGPASLPNDDEPQTAILGQVSDPNGTPPTAVLSGGATTGAVSVGTSRSSLKWIGGAGVVLIALIAFVGIRNYHGGNQIKSIA